MSYKLISHVIKGHRFFVYKINKISYRERVFCILDQKQPFELTISYAELTTATKLEPVLGGKGGFVLTDTLDFEKIYSFRMSSKEECQQNINEIEKKKVIVDEIITRLTTDIILDHNKKLPKN